MVKESNPDREPAVKKRRKGTAASSSANSTTKLFDGDIYQNVINYEEGEALLRDPEEDKTLFHETTETIRRLMSDILQLKNKPGDETKAEIHEKQIQASLLFVTLKKLNRVEKFRTKALRDTMNRVKQQVDSYHLQLQNLLYEIEHLKKEVTKCLEFKSKDEEIDLVSLEEFYKQAPGSISRQEVTSIDPHKLKLARLEWELEQRKELAVMCQKLQQAKENVAKDIQTKRERLDNLAPSLKSILEVTKPLQDYLGLPLDAIRKQHQVACLLPKPLFILFVQADAYREACDKLMSVSISGDEEEARLLKQAVTETAAAEESDSDAEESNDHNKRHHRKLSRSDRLEEKKKRLLLKHPLTVDVLVKLKDENSVQLSFCYLVNLHVVTVKPKVNLAQAVLGVSAGDLIAPHNLLTELFPHDLGCDSPNVANHHQLHALGLKGFSSYIGELGIPYVWVQRVAGLDFVGAMAAEAADRQDNVVEAKTGVSQASIESVIKRIRYRLRARLFLSKQVQALESGLVLVPNALRAKFPSKLGAVLVHWTPITWEDYQQSPITQQLVEEQLVSPADSFYSAVLTRGSARLLALVCVRCDYPRSPTIFRLQLQWHGEHAARVEEDMLEIERELNVHWQELAEGPNWGANLLAAQMRRLMTCLDISLEAGGATGISPPEFPRDKIFFQPVRGRTRTKPYKYLQVGGGIFTQR